MAMYNVNSQSLINFKNVSYVAFQKKTSETIFTFFWRYKSALREEQLIIPNSKFNEFIGNLRDSGFKIIKDYLINLDRLLFINEMSSEIVSQTKILFTFEDGQLLRLSVANDFWDYWKGSI